VANIRYSLAYYHIDWSDQQLTQFDIITTFFTNAGESSVDGIEAEIFAQPLEGLDLFLGISWTNAEFDVFQLNATNGLLGFGVPTDLSGNKIPYSPDIAISASIQYVTPLVAGLDGKIRLDGRYTGERELHFTGVLPQDSYGLVNFYIGVENENFEIGFFADNIFDEEYHALGELVPSIGPILGTGDPRTYGMKFSMRF